MSWNTPPKGPAAESATARPKCSNPTMGCIRNVQLQPANQSAIWPWPCPIAPWASRGLLDGPSTSLVYAPDGIIDKDTTPLLDPSSSSRSMRETTRSNRHRGHFPPEFRFIPHTPPFAVSVDRRNHTATFSHTLRYSDETCPFLVGLVFVPGLEVLGCLGSIRRTAVLMTRHLVSASHCPSILLLDYSIGAQSATQIYDGGSSDQTCVIFRKVYRA